MSTPDPVTLAELIAKDLSGPLGPKVVARVMHKHIGALDAPRSEGYTAEKIFEHVLHLTRETAPSVTRSALRRGTTRARKAWIGASQGASVAAGPTPLPPADRVQDTRPGPVAAPHGEDRREQLARIKERASKYGQPGSY
ncbi:hypothetical protein ILT44_11740 [Microvirga sp. BT689]|uniref:hypothetical protein n=1 Tax=Microvirga arvi TaxID=2778731 RepID=UPI0019523639|nr:hypothetical protein [Microvirga arvi]MBM6580857.1 hypothetical protein [Microvirga arvi]